MFSQNKIIYENIQKPSYQLHNYNIRQTINQINDFTIHSSTIIHFKILLQKLF